MCACLQAVCACVCSVIVCLSDIGENRWCIKFLTKDDAVSPLNSLSETFYHVSISFEFIHTHLEDELDLMMICSVDRDHMSLGVQLKTHLLDKQLTSGSPHRITSHLPALLGLICSLQNFHYSLKLYFVLLVWSVWSHRIVTTSHIITWSELTLGTVSASFYQLHCSCSLYCTEALKQHMEAEKKKKNENWLVRIS